MNPVLFTRIDEMMDNMDHMEVRERQIYQPGRTFDENLHNQNSFERPSSAPNLYSRDQRSISEYLNSDRDDPKDHQQLEDWDAKQNLVMEKQDAKKKSFYLRTQ